MGCFCNLEKYHNEHSLREIFFVMPDGQKRHEFFCHSCLTYHISVCKNCSMLMYDADGAFCKNCVDKLTLDKCSVCAKETYNKIHRDNEIIVLCDEHFSTKGFDHCYHCGKLLSNRKFPYANEAICEDCQKAKVCDGCGRRSWEIETTDLYPNYTYSCAEETVDLCQDCQQLWLENNNYKFCEICERVIRNVNSDNFPNGDGICFECANSEVCENCHDMVPSVEQVEFYDKYNDNFPMVGAKFVCDDCKYQYCTVELGLLSCDECNRLIVDNAENFPNEGSVCRKCLDRKEMIAKIRKLSSEDICEMCNEKVDGVVQVEYWEKAYDEIATVEKTGVCEYCENQYCIEKNLQSCPECERLIIDNLENFPDYGKVCQKCLDKQMKKSKMKENN